MLFFADSGEGAAAQAMLMGSATTVIVLTLLAINALDNPYRRRPGAASSRSRWSGRCGILDTRAHRVNQRTAPPCDARGVPVSS